MAEESVAEKKSVRVDTGCDIAGCYIFYPRHGDSSLVIEGGSRDAMQAAAPIVRCLVWVGLFRAAWVLL